MMNVVHNVKRVTIRKNNQNFHMNIINTEEFISNKYLQKKNRKNSLLVTGKEHRAVCHELKNLAHFLIILTSKTINSYHKFLPILDSKNS
jgi:hypothetical protein